MNKVLEPKAKGSYRFLEDIVTADVAFEATGETLEELLTSAAEALEETQVDTKQLADSEQRTVNLENNTLDKLLFDFLNELIFYKDSESLAFAKYDIKIQGDKDTGYKLTGAIAGEKLNPERHELRTDVKAVTKHRFGIKKTKEGYKATVVLDI